MVSPVHALAYNFGLCELPSGLLASGISRQLPIQAKFPGSVKTSLGGICRAVQDALSVAVFAIPGGRSTLWVWGSGCRPSTQNSKTSPYMNSNPK